VNFEEYTGCQKVDEPDLKSELSRRDVVAIMIRLEFFERDTFAGYKELNHVRSVQTNHVRGRTTQSFQHCLESFRIIAFAILFQGRASKPSHCEAETFDGIVPNPERFRQSMFQDFSLCLECLLRRLRDRRVSHLGKNRAESLQRIPSTQPALFWGLQFVEHVLN